MRVKLSKTDKLFFVYLAVLFIGLAYTFQFNSLLADEGTHLLLSIFYRDLIAHTISSGDLSFNSVYGYAINYLVHYPKLQIAYQPLYHLTNAFFFQIFGPSETIGRFVNLAYALMAFAAFYFLVKEHFGERAALIAAVLFSLSPFSLFYSSRAWLDYTSIFWLITSLLLFGRAMKAGGRWRFAVCGLATALAFLGKQICGFVLIFYLATILTQKKVLREKLKSAIVLTVAFSLLAVPYLYLFYSVGGIEASATAAIFYSVTKGDPTSLLDPMYWLLYVVRTGTVAPFFPALLLGLAYYVYKKQPHWKTMALFFAVFYICLSAVPTKELRFSETFMLPAYAAFGALLASNKRKMLPAAFLAVYCAVSIALFIPTINYYPVKELTTQMMVDIPDGSSIALLSDEDPAFSSVFMWYVAKEGNGPVHKVYRPCAFDGMSADEIKNMFRDNNVYYVVYSTKSSRSTIDLVNDDLTYLFSMSKDGKETTVYAFKEYAAKAAADKCNYICITQKEICA